MSDFDPKDFIQDFLEETGEHLRNTRQNLLTLEESLNLPEGQNETVIGRVNLINEIFRSFHTIKGLAGMVGLEQAAEVSHLLESVLRDIQQSNINLTPDWIDRLLDGTQLLESIIDTLRTPGLPIPPVHMYLDQTKALLPGQAGDGSASPPAPVQRIPPEEETALLAKHIGDEVEHAIPEEIRKALNETDQQLLENAISGGQAIALAVFTPSAEKSDQTTHVNDIRQDLGKAGSLLKAVPLIDGSQIRFAFLVSSQTPLSPAKFPPMEWTTILNPKEAGEPSRRASMPPARKEQLQPGPSAASPATALTVRVDLDRLDDLLRLVGELFVCQARIADQFNRLEINLQDKQQAAMVDAARQSVLKLERTLGELRRATTRARMVPLDEVFGYMPLAARDLARGSHKEVRLVMEGGAVEIDRALVEHLLDPLLHLVRNAITHGIETPEERIAAGKPPQGILTLRGQPAGDHILVSVCDDGRGLNFDQIARRAVDLGIWTPEEFTSHNLLSEADALNLISRTGFSTRESADLGAGRGVGLDVVARMAAETGGSLSLQSRPGQGTTFTLRLPLTLTIVNAIIVRSGEERYAIALDPIEETIAIDPREIVRLESGELYPYHGNSLVLFRLSELFQHKPPAEAPLLYGLIGGQGDRQAALLVDQLIGQREVVVRTISDPLIARPGITGATELGDGSIILILDLPVLFQYATSLRKEARLGK